MKNRTIETPTERRLAELEAEGQKIIDTYRDQVIIDANSPIIKKLQERLKAVRSEQWQIFDKQYLRVEPVQALTIAAPLCVEVAEHEYSF